MEATSAAEVSDIVFDESGAELVSIIAWLAVEYPLTHKASTRMVIKIFIALNISTRTIGSQDQLRDIFVA